MLLPARCTTAGAERSAHDSSLFSRHPTSHSSGGHTAAIRGAGSSVRAKPPRTPPPPAPPPAAAPWAARFIADAPTPCCGSLGF
eukprot:CAMPEP_0206242152 /NCGR_PEP_ID=MMETSP0047_2-20121206/16899_1 /ASSEMBLY_ACC=CAM_ASM_000192 /TAXON_ID=195065 /ORGANISM="Chroomonas mesostigmatica_cf, Strain CCMP1168" /LENGTH=83 /DNA_ID=CAMNT_0053667141 /DNA_START=91 /DNA_END=342 /DNA_ORIENTATION=-